MTDTATRTTTRLFIEMSAEDAQALHELARRCSEAGADHATHGRLDAVGLLTMLAEDAAMVIRREGSWEAARLADLLCAHGYRTA